MQLLVDFGVVVPSLPVQSPFDVRKKEDSDHVCIAGLESSIKQLALMMESFFVHHEPTVALPSSHSSILLSGSNHSKHATVPPWCK